MQKRVLPPSVKLIKFGERCAHLEPYELERYLLLTPHPNLGSSPWWNVKVEVSDNDSACVTALVDPIIAEISDLNTISLRKFLRELISGLQKYDIVPAHGPDKKYVFKIKVRYKKKQVLGTLLLGGRRDEDDRPAHQDDCPYCPSGYHID